MVIFQIEDSRPFLVHGGQPIQWHTGSAPWWITTSRMVRINKRGAAFKPLTWHVRDGLDSLPQWEHERCLPSAFGLCATPTSIAFPSQQTPVVNEALDWLCGSTATSRSVTNASRYDFSACDVLDAKTDFVLVDNTLFRSLSTDLPEWVYWAVCVLVVYLVRCLSKYVLASIRKDAKAGEYPNPVMCVAACALASVLVTSQGDFVYVTEEALLYNRFTLFYIAFYAALFAGSRTLNSMHGKPKLPNEQVKDPPFYNLLAGVMLLVASRLYCGPETPYNPPLIFIIGVRMAVKSRRGSDAPRALTLLLDAFMASLACTLGFSPHSRYLIALFCAAFAASDALV